MSEHDQHLKAVVFDWAGTTVDHGCRAPAIVFQEIFRRSGIEITPAQAREPMGMAKREHIATIAAMPEVASRWEAKYGHPCRDEDIDAMYEQFLPLQKQTLSEHCELIAGVAHAVADCRRRGLKIGSTTGYTHDLMDVVAPLAREQGYAPDCILCSEDAPRGRPAPYLLFEAAKQLDLYPMWSIVKVDDTDVGIQAGRNAGCWTVGITRTGNYVGLSERELAERPSAEIDELCQRAEQRLIQAGAHFILETAAEITTVLDEIEQRMQRGERPI
jgi:phosphonoacetaldehyde hydrolase